MSQNPPDVERKLAELQQNDVVGRIWRRDHTVWKPSPEEITNRLGWLDVADQMSERAGELATFANEVRNDGFRYVVLLGMGGSSLGAEVLRQTFPSTEGYPKLLVLDSTVPAQVLATADSIDLAHTLYLVSSKSGDTIEPNVLYSFFRSLTEGAAGDDGVGERFVAITDPGSSLSKLAREAGFRRVFQNPSDIGGRYSVLSYFGLVPAALLGIDLPKLLSAAQGMAERCGPGVEPGDNPGALLGAILGANVLNGRDKLTLVISPSIESFGLWVEQLIAESTGKEGKGIVPVAGEALLGPEGYGDDRFFVYLRLNGDDNSATDAAVGALDVAGHPVARLSLEDTYDLGAEFFRWEFATAIASALLGLQPFDQPNVQQSKDLTDRLLAKYEASGKMPEPQSTVPFAELLGQVRAGDYLAIMAYVKQTAEVDRAMATLRRKVGEKHRIATTLGYGPRFLHSTGQLHKGGANNGVFLQLTADHENDVAIPGRRYTFGAMADAQALGDLEALKVSGRRVARIHLGPDVVAGIDRLTDELG